MILRYYSQILFCFLFLFSSVGIVTAQSLANTNSVTGKQGDKDLFSEDSVLAITITGNIRQLLNDRTADPEYYKMWVSYHDEQGKEVKLETEIKTRGHFRRIPGNCDYPPLLIHFQENDTLEQSIFKTQNKTKLVMPCRGDEYVIKEYLVYKIYNLVTPLSFRARLVKVSLDDDKKKPLDPFYGILLEEEKQMATRNGLVPEEPKIRAQQTQFQQFLEMATFEYLIGNTDWSVEYLQNIKLVAADSMAMPIAVPYDFDHSGIVNAPYAKPADELQMSSIRERRYRGFCVDNMQLYDSVIKKYNALKPAIIDLYKNCPLLSAGYIKSTLAFLDDFYRTINDPRAFKKAFGYPCDPNGTGNVIIKGLRED